MHHALLFIGDANDALECIDHTDRTPTVDVHVSSFETFGIAEARTLKYYASQKSVTRPERVFVISSARITGEAQNALLKLFEDPQGEVRFYLIVPREDVLIPTLRSRFMLLDCAGKSDLDSCTESFLNASYAERLSEIARRVKEKDSAWPETILRALETYAQESGNATVAHDVLFVGGYLRNRGASPKMLLEHLALSLPVTS